MKTWAACFSHIYIYINSSVATLKNKDILTGDEMFFVEYCMIFMNISYFTQILICFLNDFCSSKTLTLDPKNLRIQKNGWHNAKPDPTNIRFATFPRGQGTFRLCWDILLFVLLVYVAVPCWSHFRWRRRFFLQGVIILPIWGESNNTNRWEF